MKEIEITLKKVPCRMEIEGEQGKEYIISIAPNVPNDRQDVKELMAETAGINMVNEWKTKGPFDKKIRRDLIGILEHNYQRETLPSDNDQKELYRVIQMITDRYVNKIIKDLKEKGFPKEAEAAFRQFAEEDFAFTVGLTIGEYWETKKGSTDC